MDRRRSRWAATNSLFSLCTIIWYYYGWLPGIVFLSSSGTINYSSLPRLPLRFMRCTHTIIILYYWFATFITWSFSVLVSVTYCVRTMARNVVDRNGTETSRELGSTCRRSGTSRNHTEHQGSGSPLGWNPKTDCTLSRWVSPSERCRRMVCWQSILCSSSRCGWKTKDSNENDRPQLKSRACVFGRTEPIICYYHLTYGTPPMYSGSSRFNSTSGELELIVVMFPLFSWTEAWLSNLLIFNKFQSGRKTIFLSVLEIIDTNCNYVIRACIQYYINCTAATLLWFIRIATLHIICGEQ